MPRVLTAATAFPIRQPILAALGDSLFAQGFTSSADFTNNRPLGPCWGPALLGQRIRLPYANNFAVSGQKWADVVATQIPALLAAQAAGAGITHAIIHCGFNDFNVTAQATVKTQTAAAWALLKNAGLQVIQTICLPRTVASWSATYMKLRDDYNQWLRDYAAANGVVLLDPFGAIADPANANGDPLAVAVQSDGIHPAQLGAYPVGVAIQRYFNQFPLPDFARPTSRGDVYDATSNPRGNLITNGLMSGTGGTNTGTGASGSVADNWLNRVLSGTLTAVGSLVARTDPEAAGWWQQVVLSATTAASYRLSPDAAISGQVAGDIVIGEVDINVTGATKLLYAQLNVFDNGGASGEGSIAFKDPGLPGLYMPAAYQVRVRTEPFRITTGNVDVPFRIELGFDAGGGATIQVGAASLRKVIAQ